MVDTTAIEAMIAVKLAEALQADTSHIVSQPGQEERRAILYNGYRFIISRGHAYRDHATGPATNPRFSGPDMALEQAIMDDCIRRIQAGPLPKVAGIASPGTAVKVHGTPIRYNVVRIKSATVPNDFDYMISDYMVWQNDPGALTY